MCMTGSAAGAAAICPTIRISSGLAHHFNAIHIIGNQVVAPMELPANARHLDTYQANLTLSRPLPCQRDRPRQGDGRH